MDWPQLLALIFGNAAIVIPLFVWNRTESRNDWRHMDNKLEIYKSETNALIEAIRQDIKDFHGRLCEIEQKNKNNKK